jgi:diacylglycerol kinase family enzyme
MLEQIIRDIRIKDSRIIVVVNSLAGKNSISIAEEFKESLNELDISPYFSRGKQEASDFVSKKLEQAEREDRMLMVVSIGGDGTNNSLFNAKGDLSRVIYVIIPAGTGNDLATSLNMRNIKKTFDMFNKVLRGEVNIKDYITKLDLMNITYDDRKAVNASYVFSLGFDGLLCKKVNEDYDSVSGVKKKSAFVTKAFSLFMRRDYNPINLKCIINNDDSRLINVENAFMATFMNHRYAGAGMDMNPEANWNDGQIEGLIAKDIGFWKFVRLMAEIKFMHKGKHIRAEKNTEGFNRFNVNYIKGIESARIEISEHEKNEKVYFEVDGEHHELSTPGAPLEVKVLKGATNVVYMPLEKSHERFAR